MSVLRMDGSEASAVPIAFLSAQRDPVGIDTSAFIPRKNRGSASRLDCLKIKRGEGTQW